MACCGFAGLVPRPAPATPPQARASSHFLTEAPLGSLAGEPPAAQVAGVRYATLEEALAAAGEYPLELCKDAASITALAPATTSER